MNLNIFAVALRENADGLFLKYSAPSAFQAVLSSNKAL